MCTLVTLSRPGHAWPLLLAANRDEALDRPWRPPAAHWPDQPEVIGGLDVLAGGTWLAVNRATGMVAAVLNRTGSLGPAPGKASRGDLPLQALRHRRAEDAAAAMERRDADAWRSFNLIIADPDGVFWVCGTGEGAVTSRRLDDGLHMVTSADPDDTSHPRTARHLPRFRTARVPEPPDWGAWPTLLADGEGPLEASLNIVDYQGFGTASSALIGVGAALVFAFAAGPPDRMPFQPVQSPSA